VIIIYTHNPVWHTSSPPRNTRPVYNYTRVCLRILNCKTRCLPLFKKIFLPSRPINRCQANNDRYRLCVCVCVQSVVFTCIQYLFVFVRHNTRKRQLGIICDDDIIMTTGSYTYYMYSSDYIGVINANIIMYRLLAYV